MNRRSFFAFLPVAPLALVAEGARAATADGVPLDTAFSITLNGASKVDTTEMKKTQFDNPDQYKISLVRMHQPDPNKAVTMAVGDDGDLWLKRKDGQWRKVVTE